MPGRSFLCLREGGRPGDRSSTHNRPSWQYVEQPPKITVSTPPRDADSPSAAPTPASFVPLALASEAGLAGLALALGAWTGTDWGPMLRMTAADVGLGVLGGLGFVALHLILIFPGGPRNPLYRTIYRPLYSALRPALRDVRAGDVVLLAVASGVGEELLFRGWMQTEAGIVAASLLFGAAHVWDRRALPYGLYAAGMGFVLGGLFAYTGPGLWAPILAHTVNNGIGLWALARGWLPEPGH